MSQNGIVELREIMFDTLRDLRNPEKPLDLDRARAISEAAQVVINSAKVEVDYLKATGNSTGTGFIEAATQGATRVESTGAGTRTVTAIPGGTITQHKTR